MSRILKSDKLWVCGQHQASYGGDEWVMVGVYSTEEKAIAECWDETYFIAPILLNGTPDETSEWVGYYRPMGN